MDPKKCKMTFTITGVPVHHTKGSMLVDMVVCADFVQLAADMAWSASTSGGKKATRMRGAIIAKATNMREFPKS